MKAKAAAAVLIRFLLVSGAMAHALKTATFEGNIDEVFDAAVKVAQADWSVSYADRKTGTLSFTTGTSSTSNGMECSAILEEVPGTQVRVTVKTQKKNGQDQTLGTSAIALHRNSSMASVTNYASSGRYESRWSRHQRHPELTFFDAKISSSCADTIRFQSPCSTSYRRVLVKPSRGRYRSGWKVHRQYTINDHSSGGRAHNYDAKAGLSNLAENDQRDVRKPE